ncbi:putative integral membrane protein [Acanthocheilonema viteae]|uniref:Uncharacterized protein n=1 Tax=Acanthocheilonema viteae TaxID=6277 RepID=A0A498S8P3_ACAVI|nr:unnamed protein product [Acanthocheilonema viteae]
MKNTTRLFFIIAAICLPQILHGTTTKLMRMERRMKNDKNSVINFRIPEYFDLRGEKFNSLMEMIKERTDMLHKNEMKRNEIHKKCLWILGVILPAYALASIIWTAANIIFYKRQRQKLESGGKENTFNRIQERQRLLERYNQIPSANLSSVDHSSLPVTEFSDDGSNLNDIAVHSSFEANRARVEAILKRNNEPQFMRRI